MHEAAFAAGEALRRRPRRARTARPGFSRCTAARAGPSPAGPAAAGPGWRARGAARAMSSGDAPEKTDNLAPRFYDVGRIRIAETTAVETPPQAASNATVVADIFFVSLWRCVFRQNARARSMGWQPELRAGRCDTSLPEDRAARDTAAANNRASGCTTLAKRQAQKVASADGQICTRAA